MRDPNELDKIDIDRMERVQVVVDAFLLQRVENPQASASQLIAEHAELMPELGALLAQVDRIDAARNLADDLENLDQTMLDTDPYNGPATSIPGLYVRCPHCFLQIRIGSEDRIEKIECGACGNSFGLVDEDMGPTIPEPIDNFEFIERLGAGSFGTVWKAHDKNLDRYVAIKLPRQGKLDGREVEQFVREARVAAQLNHPGIVRVYEVGRKGDTVYIVSVLVEGTPLSRWVPTHGIACREAAELCKEICDALHHAHEQGVVHRDLKPANIMMGTGGRPYITDFGLAKRHANDVTITADGNILGTPAYMSPEQARGESSNLDRRADIYSVGVILFELLTGERPFRGDMNRLIEKVINEEPPRLRDLRKSVPRDLETICLKCLEKDPDRRYETSQSLADDLQCWCDDLPIQARPIGKLERLRRWSIRHPVSAAIILTALTTLILTTIAGISVAKMRHEGLAKAIEELDNYRQRNSTEIKFLKQEVVAAVREIKDKRLDINNYDQCQETVNSLFAKHDHPSSEHGEHPFASWYLLDIDGRNRAVCPRGSAVGGDFHEREYFVAALEKPGMVHASKPFRSANDGLYKFALSCAIVDHLKTPQFVIAASVSTDSTRAIRREELLMHEMFRWTAVALIPNILLALFLAGNTLWRTTRRFQEKRAEHESQPFMDASSVVSNRE